MYPKNMKKAYLLQMKRSITYLSPTQSKNSHKVRFKDFRLVRYS